MIRARLRVVAAGPHVSVQDAGRPGLMRYGAPASGPMDRASYALANSALDNPPGLPCVEISLGGLTLECLEGALDVAVVGGGFRVALDSRAAPSWTVLRLEPGRRLSIRPGAWGSWAYLAFAGRLVARDWLGSRATHALSGLGGGAVAAGRELEIEGARASEAAIADLRAPAGVSDEPLRLVLGPQHRHFAPATLERLVAEPFRLTDAYDRMGVRLAGPDLTPASALDMPSEALLRGAVQVAGDGVGSVMLADHGATGGYPKIATLVSVETDRLAQRRPGDEIRFRAVTPAEAIAYARAEMARRGEAMRAAVNRHGPQALVAALFSENLIGGVVSGA